MDNLYGPLSVRITWFDCKYNETHDTILELEKIGGREGHYKKGKGSPAMLPQPLLQETCKHVFKKRINPNFHSVPSTCMVYPTVPGSL